MKISCLVASAFILGVVNIANATLWDSSTDASLMGGVVYDDVADQYWIQDISMFYTLANGSSGAYSALIDSIDGLNNYGSAWLSGDWENWHLASGSEAQSLITNNTAAEIGNVFQQANTSGSYLQGVINQVTYAGTHDVLHIIDGNHDGVFDYIYHLGSMGWTDSNNLVEAAWVVADAVHNAGGGSGVAPVPEPATMLLFGTGLAGLVGFRKKTK